MAGKGKAISPGIDAPSAAIERQSTSDLVYGHVKRLILSGSLKSGERIPEKLLAEHFQVSRTPVREAVQRLNEYGLVEIEAKPWSYAYVASITSKQARDIGEVRFSLEHLSFSKLAKCLTPEVLADLEGYVGRCRDAMDSGDYATAFEQDSLFHQRIASSTGNMELLHILKTLDSKIQLVRVNRHLPADIMQYTYTEHETLLRLLAEKNMRKIDTLLQKHIMHHLDF